MINIEFYGSPAGYNFIKEKQKYVTENPRNISPEVQNAARWLAKEAEQVKKSGQSNTLWKKLNGFDTEDAVRQVGRTLINGLQNGKKIEDLAEKEAWKVQQDMKAFVYEYLAQFPILPIFIQKREYNGKAKIIAPEYGEKLWKETVGRQERRGSMYTALFEEDKKNQKKSVEKWLLDGQEDSFVLVLSPPGWTGMKVQGNEHTFQEAQLYVYYITKEGKLIAYTFRFTPTLEQCEELQRRLNLQVKPLLNMEERIIQIVQNVAFMDNTTEYRTIKDFKDVVLLISEVMQTETVYSTTIEGKEYKHSVQEMLTFFQKKVKYNNEEIWKMHEQAPYLIEGLRESLFSDLLNFNLDSDNNVLFEDIERKMGITALQLHKLYRMEEEHKMRRFSAAYESSIAELNIFIPPSQTNYQKEKSGLSNRPGCAGSSKSKISKNWANESLLNSEEILNSDDGKCQRCPYCKETVNAIIENGKKYCPREGCEGSKTKRQA